MLWDGCVISPLTVTVIGANGKTRHYAYNAAGQVTRSTDPLGDGVGTTSYAYYPVNSSPVMGASLLESVTSRVAGSSNTDTVAYTAVTRSIG